MLVIERNRTQCPLKKFESIELNRTSDEGRKATSMISLLVVTIKNRTNGIYRTQSNNIEKIEHNRRKFTEKFRFDFIRLPNAIEHNHRTFGYLPGEIFKNIQPQPKT